MSECSPQSGSHIRPITAADGAPSLYGQPLYIRHGRGRHHHHGGVDPDPPGSLPPERPPDDAATAIPVLSGRGPGPCIVVVGPEVGRRGLARVTGMRKRIRCCERNGYGRCQGIPTYEARQRRVGGRTTTTPTSLLIGTWSRIGTGFDKA